MFCKSYQDRVLSILLVICGILLFTVSDIWCCKIRLRQDELIKLGRLVKKWLIVTQIFSVYPSGPGKVSY